MSIEILIQAFEQAEKEVGSNKKTHLAQHLSDLLFENYQYQINERTLRDYYTNYKKGAIGTQDDLKPKLISCLCKYLGYEDYAHFINKNPGVEIKPPGESPIKGGGKKKRRWIISISISIAFGVVYITSLILDNKSVDNKCMTWSKTHYEEVSCTKKFSTTIEPLDPIKVANFKKVEVNMATHFFDEQTNKPRIWYHKNKKGEIEYFTAPGLHPVTGKTLDEITPYIIDKYVPLHSS